MFLNNKEYPRRTQNGQLRIQTIGPVEVRVQKVGFENSPAQTAVVKKGSEVRLEFKLKPMLQSAALHIEGATPGAEVLIDQRRVGAVADDGSFHNDSVTPGDHVIGLRRDRFAPKQFSRNFTAGQTVTISGADAALVAERAPAPSAASSPRAQARISGSQAAPGAGYFDGRIREPGRDGCSRITASGVAAAADF